MKSLRGCLIITNHGAIVGSGQYQTMVPNPGVKLIWKQVSEIPSCAIPTGQTQSGQPLYSGMVVSNKRVPSIGKVEPITGTFYYVQNNTVQKETSFFNILCTHEQVMEN